MILACFIALPLCGALLAWLSSFVHWRFPFWITLLSLLALAGVFAEALVGHADFSSAEWLLDFKMSWFARYGVSFHLGLDALSAVMCALSMVMAFVAVLVSTRHVGEKAGFFYAGLLSMLAGLMGIFLALDMLLFFMAWEVALIPFFLLILGFGEKDKMRTTTRFFIFTQGSGLVMLASIFVMVFVHYMSTQHLSFDYLDLRAELMEPSMQMLLIWGFLLAFLIKLPAFPFHVWMVDVIKDSPVAAVLIGIMVKTGAYGLLRFVLPLFPAAAAEIAPIMMGLGVVTMVFGAVLAYGQAHVHRLLAYATVSHMGVVLAAIFSMNVLAYEGAVLLVLASALATGGLLIVQSYIHDLLPDASLKKAVGLFSKMPRGGVIAIVLVMASVGVPGFLNFAGEMMALVGIFAVDEISAALLAAALVMGAIYALWFLQQIFFGKLSEAAEEAPDLPWLHSLVGVVLIVLLLGLGLYPKAVLHPLERHWALTQKTSTVEFDEIAPVGALEEDGFDDATK